jgi:hypothetical protein
MRLESWTPAKAILSMLSQLEADYGRALQLYTDWSDDDDAPEEAGKVWDPGILEKIRNDICSLRASLDAVQSQSRLRNWLRGAVLYEGLLVQGNQIAADLLLVQSDDDVVAQLPGLRAGLRAHLGTTNASLDDYVRLLDSIDMDWMQGSRGRDLPELIQGVTERGAKGKTIGVLDAAVDKIEEARDLWDEEREEAPRRRPRRSSRGQEEE